MLQQGVSGEGVIQQGSTVDKPIEFKKAKCDCFRHSDFDIIVFFLE